MRLWSFHPMHLDDPALRSVWRAGLEAIRQFRGERTWRGRDPHLERWRAHPTPVNALATYLHLIQEHATTRGARFQRPLIPGFSKLDSASIQVTSGQLALEWQIYLSHLRHRDIQTHEVVKEIKPRPHPLFVVVAGEVESWEREGIRC